MTQLLGAFDPLSLLPIVGSALTPLLTQAISTVEIRTEISPPVMLSMADLLNNSAPPSPFARFLKPTVILTDKNGGRNVIAPFGVATGSVWPGVMLIATILSVGFIAGRASKRSK